MRVYGTSTKTTTSQHQQPEVTVFGLANSSALNPQQNHNLQFIHLSFCIDFKLTKHNMLYSKLWRCCQVERWILFY